LQETKGDVSLVCLNSKSQKFIFDNEDSFEEDDIEEFINKFMKNELKPTYKSEIEPKDNSKKLVKILVGSTFVTILEQNINKHAIIYFYKKDCDNCATFDFIFTKLAKHFAKNKKLLFGKMNTDLNEYPNDYESKDYPALFIRKENQGYPVLFDYTPETTVDDLISFVNEIIKSDDVTEQEKPKESVREDTVPENNDKKENEIHASTTEKLETEKVKEDEIIVEEKPKKEKTIEEMIPEVMADLSKVKRVKVVSERKVEL
jgi:hypothetical protein